MSKERTKLTKKLDNLCMKIIRLRDDNRCQVCGKVVQGGNAHTSHIVPKGNGASWRRFDLLNLLLKCMHCHIYWWHKNPTESGKWFTEKYPARDKHLDKYRGGKPCPISTAEMKELVDEYKDKLKLLERE